MYNEKLAHAILRRLDQEFPGSLNSDDLREFHLPDFKSMSRVEWNTAIDALLKLGYVTGNVMMDGPTIQYVTSMVMTPQGRIAAKDGGFLAAERDSHLVFLSHAAADAKIAFCLKSLMESAIPGSKVFVSSDPEDLRAGDPWVETILHNLSHAKALIVLATDRGMNRRWVWYETGAGWSRGVRVIPCCVGALRKGQLVPPFSGYQALNADDREDLKALLKAIATELHLGSEAADVVAYANELKSLDGEARRASITATIPEEVQARVDAANVSATIEQGIGQTFVMLLTNESKETVIVRKIEMVDRQSGTRLASVYEPDLTKGTIKPKERTQLSWNASPDPAANLITLYYSRRANPSDQNFDAEIVVNVGCEILGRYKVCPTMLQVQVDSWNHRITQFVRY